MICSSVNFDLVMSGPLIGPDSSIRGTSYRGSQQSRNRAGKGQGRCRASTRTANLKGKAIVCCGLFHPTDVLALKARQLAVIEEPLAL